MSDRDRRYIVWIPVLLILMFLLFPLLDKRQGRKMVYKAAEEKTRTGWVAYDLLPPALKLKMKELQAQEPMDLFYFCYYFESEDVNQHYYRIDAQHEMIAHMPVTNPEVLALMEEKMTEDKGTGYSRDYGQLLFTQTSAHQTQEYQPYIAYVLPDDKAQADFRQLRVGIFKEVYPKWLAGYSPVGWERGRADTTYLLSAVEEAPEPVRGGRYFEKILKEDIKRQATFLWHELEGDVQVAFTIGRKAKSPQVIEGFSSRDSCDICYRADGAIIKAINESKVQWKAGKRKGQYVDVRLAVVLSFHSQNQEIQLSMSGFQDPAMPQK